MDGILGCRPRMRTLAVAGWGFRMGHENQKGPSPKRGAAASGREKKDLDTR